MIRDDRLGKPSFLSLPSKPTAVRISRSLQSFTLLGSTANRDKLKDAYAEVEKLDEDEDLFQTVSPV
jgi:hypothetical protein